MSSTVFIRLLDQRISTAPRNSVKADSNVASPIKADEPEEPWLTEELLERVFAAFELTRPAL